MEAIKDGILLKIWVNSDQTIKGTSLYDRIVLKAKELGLARANVVRGVTGYIGDDKIHKPKLFGITQSQPVMIEIIDTEQNVNKLLPFLDESIRSGLVTLMPVSAKAYKKGGK
jgi:uncharacterized protein